MDFYKKLLQKTEKLPSGTEFMISQAYGEGWKEVPAKEKIRLGKYFLKEVREGRVSGVVFKGMKEGKTHSHKWYQKL